MLDGAQMERQRMGEKRLAPRPERWQMPAAGDDDQSKSKNRRFHPGMRVQHGTWGGGMVLNSAVENDDEIVDIFFEEVGLKRVVASLAGLEIRP